jgi:ectoine hydroxylase
MQDIYPTRSTDEFSLMERQDPVVYSQNGSAMGPLTRPQLEQYDRDGFLFLENFFAADEVEAMQKELCALRQSEEVAKKGGTIIEPASQDVRSVFDVTRLSHLFWMLSRDSRLVDMIRQILDDDLYIHQSRINFKPGFKGKEFYWHSDFETWHAEDGMPRMRAVSCSIALTENNEHNGPLMVIPGSHKHFVSCAGKTPKDHYKDSLRKQEYGVPDDTSLATLADRGGIVAPKGAAGSVLLFECNTMHGSNGNISPYPRSNVFLVYNAVSNALVAPFQADQPRPEFIASRDFSPITPVDSGSLVANMEAIRA